MVARILKCLIRVKLRTKMQELKLPLEEPYRCLLVDFLNLVFGQSLESTSFWNTTIKSYLASKFCYNILILPHTRSYTRFLTVHRPYHKRFEARSFFYVPWRKWSSNMLFAPSRNDKNESCTSFTGSVFEEPGEFFEQEEYPSLTW